MIESCIMEDLAVLDLLECPLCMEPLDVSAKVLPCQHTFCKSCLQQHEASHHHQMCCPECRTAVPGSVEELPTNPLLVRLLESLQERVPLGTPRDRSGRYVSSTVQENLLGSYIQDLPKQEQDTQWVRSMATCTFVACRVRITNNEKVSFVAAVSVFCDMRLSWSCLHVKT